MTDHQNQHLAAAAAVAAVSDGTHVKKRSRDNNDDDNNNDDVHAMQDKVLEQEKNNPLYLEHYNFLQSLSDIERNYFFSNGTSSSKRDSTDSTGQHDGTKTANTTTDVTTTTTITSTTITTTTIAEPSVISVQRRGELWDLQSTIGTFCINQYSWVTPNQQCYHIMSHFVPLIEIGCGTNAYWCQQLLSYVVHSGGQPQQSSSSSSSSSSIQNNNNNCTMDNDAIIVGYDISPIHGGKINDADDTKVLTTTTNTTTNNTITPPFLCNDHYETEKTVSKPPLQVLLGGPEVLAWPEHQNRTLFLCYPDENDHPTANSSSSKNTATNNNNNARTTTGTVTTNSMDDPKIDDADADEEDVEEDDQDDNVEEDELTESYSMAYECMKYYTGDIVIHVGELMSTTGPILGRDTAPYGRTTSIQFQEYLYTHFHCILQYKLPLNWLHTNQDYLTVWKRSTNTTTIVYGTNNDETDKNDHDEENDDDDDEEEEVQYRHIPVEERLPVINIAAPCVQHLWLS